MRHLTLGEVLELYRLILEQAGGTGSLRDLGALESALAQPRMSFGGEDLYPTLVDKATALAYSLILNHPFTDGNKRIGHAAMETMLVLNGYELEASVEEGERVILGVAAGTVRREEFLAWVRDHMVRLDD